MIVYLSVLVMVVGLVLFFAVRNNSDVRRVGEWMFVVGLLVTLLSTIGQHAIRIP